ncbi:MAG: dihydroneopterin aldolase [Clostridium sp.]|uniref:dihydroneopterin aldolase n=1 Tax=Clostridium sp. TaxID=1506 RepID=UPI00290B28F8|nr:dihydroneopterin aldolase [Clostridium sp.]MDU7339200.1 dihydroneopterin aldolase [Clostridium sp.]
MDKIIVKGLRVFAYHGVNAEEKRDGQNFEVDVTASVDLSAACSSDCIDDTVSYAKILKTTVRVMKEQSYDLLERVAQRIAEQLFQDFPQVMELEVLLKKPEAPIQADFDYTAVLINRKRSDFH